MVRKYSRGHRKAYIYNTVKVVFIETKEEILIESQRIESKIKEKNTKIEGEIQDCVLNEAAYNSSKYKCCFVLKEAYDEFDKEQGLGGGWSLSEVSLKYRNSALARCSAIAYSINHEFCDTEGLSDEQLEEGHQLCCLINLNKAPARSTTKQDASFRQKVEQWSRVVQLQLIDANPDIIIFGYTWDNIPTNEYPFEDDQSTKKKYWDETGKWWAELTRTMDRRKVHVNTYHPGRKGIGYEKMLVDGIKDLLV